MARYDHFVGGEDEDRGCVALATVLGRPVRCLSCPLPECLEMLTTDEAEVVIERLRLLMPSIGRYSREELAHRLQAVG